jgi:hypothetical protein
MEKKTHTMENIASEKAASIKLGVAMQILRGRERECVYVVWGLAT